MQLNEAKEIFAQVIKNECVICSAPVDTLCNTKREWVHEERIDYAFINNDRYLRIVALKKIRLPKNAPNLGDAYAAVADSAFEFHELFTAFNREATKLSTDVVSRPSLSARGLYFALLTTLKTLEQEFEQLTELYQKQNLNEDDRLRYAELTTSVAKLNRDFARFSDAMAQKLAQAPEDDRTFEHFKGAVQDLRREYFRFSLDYWLYAEGRLNDNLGYVFETFASAPEEDKQV